jgi:hypothetical protein
MDNIPWANAWASTYSNLEVVQILSLCISDRRAGPVHVYGLVIQRAGTEKKDSELLDLRIRSRGMRAIDMEASARRGVVPTWWCGRNVVEGAVGLRRFSEVLYYGILMM